MRRLASALGAIAVAVLGLGHISFGLTNFQPGFPVAEGVTSLIAGVGLLAALVVARWSLHRAFLTALLTTLPLVGWFAYAVPVQGSSDPVFLVASLVIPTLAAIGAIRTR